MEAAEKLALVIDDEESMRDSCRQVLEKAEWQVITAPDGAAGYRLYRECAPDIVFIDLKMPGLSGMDLLSRIAAEDPSVATIVITGYATVESAVEAMKQGAYDFLPKPFTSAELRVVAWRNLEKRLLFIKNQRLQAEKERMQENFVTLVSHEMRAPLAAVGQYIEVILADLAGPLADKQRQILLQMQHKTEWLMALVKEWLSMSRIQGRIALADSEPFDIEPLVHEAVDLVAPQAREQRVQISVSGSGGPARLEGDREALLHVFLNLVSNAVKYNHHGGEVQVAVETRAEQMVVTIRDNGWGISEEDMPFVFDEFYRAQTERMPKTTGTGLGLSIVKKLVEAHHGRVTVDSALGEGTTFTVYLPLKQPRKVAASEAP
ncbi:MAG: hybrid sensor histidine kinase/response regulator [Planctomycetes bacterium]|nr:hybrid sensor histidine kinase/response regulator [Planctomycetota bacterium]